jgi:hypothetical protein
MELADIKQPAENPFREPLNCNKGCLITRGNNKSKFKNTGREYLMVQVCSRYLMSLEQHFHPGIVRLMPYACHNVKALISQGFFVVFFPGKQPMIFLVEIQLAED